MRLLTLLRNLNRGIDLVDKLIQNNKNWCFIIQLAGLISIHLPDAFLILLSIDIGLGQNSMTNLHAKFF